MITVLATREGLPGHVTASGYVIDLVVPFCALPSTHALFRFVRILNPLTDRAVMAVCLDIGPWNEHDDDYVFNGHRPAAESGLDTRGRVTNHAGIDLSERVWQQLGMIGNSDVTWDFV